MRKALLAIIGISAMASGCGFYISRGGGGYTLIGPGSDSLARRCSTFYSATH